ncbi:hypothetical protein L6V77_34485, partial [Myxococcota bacterium]|nr:hypothetical protein [Myxococcota bacterium]
PEADAAAPAPDAAGPAPDAAPPAPETDRGEIAPPTPDAAPPAPEVDQGGEPPPVADAEASAEPDAGPTKRGGAGNGCSQGVGRAPQAPWALLLAALLGAALRTRAIRRKLSTTDRAAR